VQPSRLIAGKFAPSVIFPDSYHRSVDDVQALVDGALSDVRSAAHIRRLTRATLDTIYKSATGKTRVPRRHRDVDDPEYVHASVRVLQDRLDGMRLASWKVEDHAALLMRTPKTADYNALSEIVSSRLVPR
jgi:hypothetical protein